MKAGSWYFVDKENASQLVRMVATNPKPNYGKQSFRVWVYEPYFGPDQPSLQNWTIVMVDGKKYKYLHFSPMFTAPGSRLVKVTRKPVPEPVPYWLWDFDTFRNKVRAESASRLRYSDPTYFSQRHSRQTIYYVYVNRDTLQVQKSSKGAEIFRSTDESSLAKRDAHEYILRRVVELGLLDRPKTNQSILNRSTDLLGEPKEVWMLTRQQYGATISNDSQQTLTISGKVNGSLFRIAFEGGIKNVFTKGVSFTGEIADTPVNRGLVSAHNGRIIQVHPAPKVEQETYYAFHTERALRNGLYQKAIDEGRITATDATIIMQSAGLDIADQMQQSGPNMRLHGNLKSLRQQLAEL